jgi:hypothetical protein
MKLWEHYGIHVPTGSVRVITQRHGQQMLRQEGHEPCVQGGQGKSLDIS